MKTQRSLRLVTMIATAVLAACSGTAQRQAAAPAGAAGTFASALLQARRDPGVRRQLTVEAEGRMAEGVTSVLLFGDGVAVLNGKRQFAVRDETVVAVLDLLIARDVASWPEESSLPEGNALEIYLRLLITIGEESHLIIERNKRPARPALQELLRELAELVRPAASSGVEVSSLEEGLRLLAEGALAPHVLTINALAPALPGAAAGSEGWQLTLQRGVLEIAEYTFAAGVRPISRRPVFDDVPELARLLLESKAARLPRQVHLDEGHFQLHLKLLGHRLSVQARPFAGGAAKGDDEARRALVVLRERLRERFAREAQAAARGGPQV